MSKQLRRLRRRQHEVGKRLQQSLPVIPDPNPDPKNPTRTVLVIEQPIKGDSKISCMCGACGRQLTDGVGLEQIESVVIQCPGCGAFNDASAAKAPS